MLSELSEQLKWLQSLMERLSQDAQLTDKEVEEFDRFQQFMFTFIQQIKPVDEDFPFKEEETRTAWKDWLEHRLNLEKPYKPVRMRATLRHLKRISGGSPGMFCAMIDAAIHKGYADITAGIRMLLERQSPPAEQPAESLIPDLNEVTF